jgi:hypothetical protein
LLYGESLHYLNIERSAFLKLRIRNHEKKPNRSAAFALLLAIPQAYATLFSFSYTTEQGQVLAGQLDGTLQSDNNTVFVNSILDFATFNGVNGPSLTYVGSAVQYMGLPVGLPTLSLDGTIMDLIACSSDCTNGFLFDTSGVFGNALHISLEGTFEAYNPVKWSMQATAVPAPATAGLLGLALVGLFGMRKKLNFGA